MWAGAPAGTPLEDIVDAIWDEPKAGHVTASTYGAYLDAAVSGVSTGISESRAIAMAVGPLRGGDTPRTSLSPSATSITPRPRRARL